MILDLFAGPGGWDVAARQFGMDPLGIEQDASACQRRLLQSFPADYPWQGSKTKQYQQVGNAIPPGLALYALSMATGLAVPASQEQAEVA